MHVLREIAERHDVDPNDDDAVSQFFARVALNLSPDEQNAIVTELLDRDGEYDGDSMRPNGRAPELDSVSAAIEKLSFETRKASHHGVPLARAPLIALEIAQEGFLFSRRSARHVYHRLIERYCFTMTVLLETAVTALGSQRRGSRRDSGFVSSGVARSSKDGASRSGSAVA
jgi:hypothetical protein